MTFNAATDAYASSASPSANFGSETKLEVDDAPPNSNAGVTHTYLRFDVDGLTGTVSRATLRLYVLNGDKDGFDVSGVSDNSWLEHEITWDNAPASASNIVASSGGFESRRWVSVDVTPLVSGNGSVSIELRSTSSRSPMEFASREMTESTSAIRASSTLHHSSSCRPLRTRRRTRRYRRWQARHKPGAS